jgi:hypothetical protein
MSVVRYSHTKYRIQQRYRKPSTKPRTKDDAVKIVPATGWVFDGKGNVTLISHASNANLGSTPCLSKEMILAGENHGDRPRGKLP